MAWGSRQTNPRGVILEEWAAELSLILLNRSRVSTFVRRTGESIIDLTWASPSAARMVRSWGVAEHEEHLSDHRYIRVVVEVAPRNIRRPPGEFPRPRWATKRLDEDALMASVISAAWLHDSHTRGRRPPSRGRTPD